MTTLQTVQQLLAKELELDPAMLDPAKPLEDIGVDSLSVIECLFKLEDAFQITVANSDSAVRNLQEIADMVDRLVAAKRSLVS